MRIQSSYNLNRNYIKPAFTEYRGVELGEKGEMLYRMDTCSFRHDLAFDDCIRFLDKKYENSRDVKFVVHACSIGEEAYSFNAQLDDTLGKRADKFRPIIAIDKNPECINIANNPVYTFRRYELDNAEYQLKKPLDFYYKLLERGYCYEKREPVESLKKSVIFRQGDIFNDVKNLRSYDTVLAARNFWPYLTKEESVKLVYEIAKRFDKSCTLIVGSFDREFDLDYILKAFMFKKTSVENVYEKVIDFLPPLEKFDLEHMYRQYLSAYIPPKKVSPLGKYLKAIFGVL